MLDCDGMSPLALFCVSSLLLTSVADDPMLEGLSPPERRMLDPLRERILGPEALLDALGLHGDERVADVGAGPGFFTLKLARRLPKGKVLATDIDGAALTVLQRRAAAAGIANIETLTVSAENPGLGAESLDLAFLCQVDHYLRDREVYFRALRAALRPNGRLALINLSAHREADRAAATAAGFRNVHELKAPPGYFVLICDK